MPGFSGPAVTRAITEIPTEMSSTTVRIVLVLVLIGLAAGGWLLWERLGLGQDKSPIVTQPAPADAPLRPQAVSGGS